MAAAVALLLVAAMVVGGGEGAGASPVDAADVVGVVGVVGVAGVAHAKITGSAPAEGSVVEQAPDVVTLSVDAKPATIEGDPLQVYGPGGHRIDDGRISLSDEGRRIAVGIDPTRPRPAGRYEIVYRIVSADTHMIAGRLRFDARVAVPAVAPAERPDAAPAGGLLHAWPVEVWPPAVAAAALALVAGRIAWRRRRRRRAIEAGPPLLPPMQGHLVAPRAAAPRPERAGRVGSR